MATNLKAKRQKLYFDLLFPKTTTNSLVCCTQVTNGTPGDRYGNLLAAVAALTGSAPSSVKARSEVTAWFVPNFASAANATAPNSLFFVQFCTAVANGVNKGATKLLPYLTAGTLTPLNQFSGHSAVFATSNTDVARHFGILVRRRGTGATNLSNGLSVAGTLYVQRQHSIEV